MDTPALAEAHLQDEIEALRLRHQDTQELYREVCVLLFFRHGITPTTNKLYQLVRKGSMSAPAEALSRFWETLREKSRVRIEHPDLPASLQESAGEMIGALWQQARAGAQEALEQFREDCRAQVTAAEEAAKDALATAESARNALASSREARQALQMQLTSTQADLARAQGEVMALERQVQTASEQHRALQDALSTSQQRFTEELEQQRAASAMTVAHHGSEVRRLLLDVDRERSGAAKLQKELDLSRRANSEQVELSRQKLSTKQVQMDELAQRNAALEGSVGQIRGQRDQLLQEASGLRERLETISVERAELERQLKQIKEAKEVKQAADAAKPGKPRRATTRA